MDKAKSGRIGLYILIISILVPGLVAILFYIPNKTNLNHNWIHLLPHINAVVNSMTALVLVIGYIFIKSGRIEFHKKSMLLGFLLGVVFLISYIIYHASADSTIFGDLDGNGILSIQESDRIGTLRSIYLIILLVHILLAVIVVPFVLFAFYFALSEKFEKHKKIAKFTLPLWFIVSITGVIVYLMINPYYK